MKANACSSAVGTIKIPVHLSGMASLKSLCLRTVAQNDFFFTRKRPLERGFQNFLLNTPSNISSTAIYLSQMSNSALPFVTDIQTPSLLH